MSMSTFILIAFGGEWIRAGSLPMQDGGSMPVIEHLHGEDWRLLVSWDAMRLSPADAEAHATKCIAWVREEASKQGVVSA